MRATSSSISIRGGRKPLGEDEATQQEIRSVLDKTSIPRRLSRIVVAVNAPGKGLGMASTQHFTYCPGENGYQEDRLYRGLHPMMRERDSTSGGSPTFSL